MGSSAVGPSDGEAPNLGTQLPKVSSESKIVAAPHKSADRSSLLQAYQKQIASGQIKDIINLVVVGGFRSCFMLYPLVLGHITYKL